MERPKLSWHTKITAVFTVLFVGFFLFVAGLDAGRTYYVQTALDLTIGAFFLAILLAIAADKWNGFESRIETARYEAEQKAMKAVAEITEMFAKMEQDRIEQERVQNIFEAIVKDVTKGKNIKKSDLPKIEKAFHENVEDRWVRVQLHGKDHLEVEINNQPFPEAAPAKKKPAAKKPVTKPQGRRVAATKKASK